MLITEHEKTTFVDSGTRHSLWWKIGAFLFAMGGVSAFSLSVFYVVRPAVASGPSSNRVLNYQIRLTNAFGAPVADGTRNIVISFYDAATVGTTLHTDCGTTGIPTARKVVFSNGVGTVLIGDTAADASHNCTDSSAPNALPATLFNSVSLFLGISVDGDAEMTPRKRIAAQGYSLNADRLDDLETSEVGGSVAFVPVTDSTGNLTLTKNLTVDGTTLFVDSTSDRVGIGTAAPEARFSVVNGSDRLLRVSSGGTTMIGSVTSTLPAGYQISAPAFSEHTLTGGATSLSLVDDQVSAAVALPFTFTFFDTNYTQLFVSSNGFITFVSGSPHGCCAGQNVPIATAPNGVIAGYWDDLDPSSGGTIKYETFGSPGTRVFVIEFRNVPEYNGSGTTTFQIKLFESESDIEIHSASVTSTNGNLHTQGIENDTGTIGYAVTGRKAAVFNLTNDAVRFKYTSGLPSAPIELGTGTLVVQNTSFFNGNVGVGVQTPNTALDLSGSFSWRGLASAPTLSPAGQARLYFDTTTNQLRVSQNGATYRDLLGIAGSGTVGRVARFSATDTVAAGGLVDNGVNAGIGVTIPDSQFDVGGTSPSAHTGNSTTGKPKSIAVQNDTLYIASGVTASPRVNIYSLDRFQEITALSAIDTGLLNFGVAVQGKTLYVQASTQTFGVGNEELRTYDVSNPAVPVFRGSIVTGTSDNADMTGPTPLAVNGRYAYLLQTNLGQLHVYDVADPASPRFAGSVATGSGGSIVVHGKFVYHVSGTSLRVFDVSNPASPTLVATSSLGTNLWALDFEQDHIYAVDKTTNQLRVYDVENPASPVSKAVVTVCTSPRAVVAHQRVVYVGCFSPKRYERYNVRFDTSPTLIDFASGGVLQPEAMAVIGRKLIAAGEASLVQMFNVDGAFLQNVNAGSIQTSSLAVSRDLHAGNIEIAGGAGIGESLQVDGDAGFSGSSAFKGNVGIGITVPNTALDVAGALSVRQMAAPALSPLDQGRIYFDSTTKKFRVSENGGIYTDLVQAGASNAFVSGGNSFGGTAVLGTNDNFPLHFETNGTTKMALTEAGNLGLGITGPTDKFHVDNGNIKITSATESAFKNQRTGTVGLRTNPIFEIGRIVAGGINEPELRFIYDDDGISEKDVFIVENTGTVASVINNGCVPITNCYQSQYEGFMRGDVKPLFRLTSNELQFGPGGNTETDLKLGRNNNSANWFFETNGVKRLFIGSTGELQLPGSTGAAMTRPAVAAARIPGEIAGTDTASPASDSGFLRLSAGGGSAPAAKSYIDISGYSTVPDMDQNIVFGTNGNEQMRIVANGNVGINNDNPTTTLDVFGSFNFNGDAFFGDAPTDTISIAATINTNVLPSTDDGLDLGSNTNRWRDLYLGPATLHVGTSTSDEGVLTYDTSTNRLQIDSTGTVDVGGGSGSTGCSVDASGNFSCAGTIAGGGGGSAAFVNGGNSFGAAGTIGTNDNFNLAFETNNATRMTLDTAGNVGIGDTTPASPLTVGNGDLFQVNASGNLIKINNVTYSWPSSQGGASTVLTNNGSGTMSWAAAGASASLNNLSSTAVNANILPAAAPTFGAGYTLTTVDSTGDAGQYSSLAIGTDGLPVISYYDVANGDLKVVKCGNASCSSGNTTTTVDSTGDVGAASAIAIGTDGFPVISYNDTTANRLKVAKCANAACTGGATITLVDTVTMTFGRAPSSIIVPADGLPVISYYYTDAADLRVIKCGNSSCSSGNVITTVDTVNNNGDYSSIAISGDGFPVISYYENVGADLRVTKCGNAACSAGNTTTVVDSTGNVGRYSSIAVPADGLPVISYQDFGGSIGLKVAKCANAACSGSATITTVDSTSFSGYNTSIDIAGDGFPFISFTTSSTLKVADCGNASCSSGNTLTTVDTGLGFSFYSTSLAVPADTFPVISYYNASAATLKVAKAALPGYTGGASLGSASLYFNSVYAATFSAVGSVAIGTATPLSSLDVNGGMAVGSYAGTNAAPTNGLIVSGNVGIGDASPTNKLDVTGAIGISDTAVIDSSRRFFAANGALGAGTLAYSFSADTNTGIYGTGSDVFRIVTAGADRVTVDALGNVGIGISPTRRLDVLETDTSTTTGPKYMSNHQLDVTPGAGGQAAGARRWALGGYARIPAGNTVQVREINGVEGSSENYGTGPVERIQNIGWAYNAGNATVGTIIGQAAWAESDLGTVSNLTGLEAWTGQYGGTVTNVAAISILGNDTSGATVTNRYQLLMGSEVGTATNSWGIYQADSAIKNYFAGMLSIGDATPDSGRFLTVGNNSEYSIDTSGNVFTRSGLSMSQVGAVSSQIDWNWFTKDAGTQFSVEAGDRMWNVSARSDQYTTAAERNDLIWSRYDGAGFSQPLVFDGATGFIGIGTNTPTIKLHVIQASAAAAAFDRTTDDGTILSLRQDGTEEGSISVSGTTISYNAFTGSHYAWTDETIEQGMLVSYTGQNRRLHGNDDSEILYGITPTAVKNDPAVLGVYLSLKEPSQPANDDNPHLVMAVGNGDLWVVEGEENIEPGDYLMSSDTPGHGMKDEGSDAVSNLIARAAEPIDWNAVTETVGGKKHKKISVTFVNFTRSSQAQTAELTVAETLDYKGYGIENVAFLRGLNGNWSIDESGLLIARSVDVESVKTQKLTIKNDGDDRTAGTGVIPTGALSATVDNPNIDARSLIGVTFEGNPGSIWWIGEKGNGKFVLNLSAPASGDVKFTYWVVGVEGEEAPPAPPAEEPALEPAPEPSAEEVVVPEEPVTELPPTVDETSQNDAE